MCCEVQKMRDMHHCEAEGGMEMCCLKPRSEFIDVHRKESIGEIVMIKKMCIYM
jgi:hypothetical protein